MQNFEVQVWEMSGLCPISLLPQGGVTSRLSHAPFGLKPSPPSSSGLILLL